MAGILFLAHRVPWPPDRGDKIRSYHILKALARLAPVTLVAFADDAEEARAAQALAPLLAGMTIVPRAGSRVRAGLAALARRRPVSLAAFDSAAMRHAVADALADARIDRVFAFSGQMAQFVPNDRPELRFVMDFVDMDSAKFADYAAARAGPARWLHAREARLLRRFEAATAARADLSLFVSAAEAALFEAETGAHNVAVLENGIDLAFFDPAAGFSRMGPGDGPLIVFTGQMDYAPNAEAVTAFARGPFVAVRERHPRARFAIVGRSPTPGVRALARLPGVTVTGGVPEVRSWLAAADVVVAPLALARGVQNKVLEAMAMARPVVASPQAHEGIDALPGRDLIVASAATQADAILRLLADPPRAVTLGQAARARMATRYAWAERLAPLAEMMALAPARLDAVA